MVKITHRVPQTLFARIAILATLVITVLPTATPATAGCASEVMAIERMLSRTKPPAVARGRAQREIEAARQASSERMCRKHLEAAMQYIQPEEPAVSRQRGAVRGNCELDPTCPREVRPENELRPDPGGFAVRRCRRDGGCPE
jgi:hypothetical protein